MKQYGEKVTSNLPHQTLKIRKMKKLFLLIVFIGNAALAQELIWTGEAENLDFFDEQNWMDANTNATPSQGSVNPNTPINFNLNIVNVSTGIQANGTINLGMSSLSISNSSLNATAFSGGQISLHSEAYVNLSANNPLQNNAGVDFTSPVAWLRLLNVTPVTASNNHLTQFTIDDEAAVDQSNLRIDNYYENGSVIRSSKVADGPLLLYSNENVEGNSAELHVDLIYSGSEIPNNLNNTTSSFVLKKGYMATFAENPDGTGKSKNYIAIEDDLIVDELPAFLNNKISFVRVLPWNWVSKKGRGGGGTSTLLNNTWFYHWNNNMNSTLALEYVPMSWGANGANNDAAIQNYLTKDKSTHVLAFNESDNCEDQSGQYNDLCQVPVAVSIYENLMKTGMRLVSPNGRENAPFGWLLDFYNLANQNDIRIDVIGVHWYDWGSNPQNSPNANPNQIFQRFQNYLQNVYDLYGLPIWITEFNANPNRTNQVNYEFMQLALPYLESLDYVERYAWFEPFSDVADYTDANGNLTNVGNFYTNQVSTPSISETVWTENNNLENYLSVIDPTGENLIINGFFETGDLFGWEGNNIGILTNNNANIYDGTTSGRILANAGELYQMIEVEPNAIYEVSLFTKWFVQPSAAIEVKIIDTDNNTVIASQLTGTSTAWNQIQFEFTTPNEVSEIQFLIEKGNEPGWFIDNVVMLKTGTLSLDQFDNQPQLKVYPNPSSEALTLVCSESMEIIYIYDVQGRLMKQTDAGNKNETKIDVSNLNSGMYLLHVNTKSGKSISKKIQIK